MALLTERDITNVGHFVRIFRGDCVSRSRSLSCAGTFDWERQLRKLLSKNQA